MTCCLLFPAFRHLPKLPYLTTWPWLCDGSLKKNILLSLHATTSIYFRLQFCSYPVIQKCYKTLKPKLKCKLNHMIIFTGWHLCSLCVLVEVRRSVATYNSSFPYGLSALINAYFLWQRAIWACCCIADCCHTQLSSPLLDCKPPTWTNLLL